MRLRRKARIGLAVFATVGCLVGLMAGVALAETTTTGVSASAVISIADAAKAPSDSVVTVTGTVAAGAEANEYTLTDGTGTIKIDGGPAWYLKTELAIGAVYTIIGEVGRGKDGKSAAEIDIYTATNDKGVVTTVRAGGGRPPWAGGPNNHDKLPPAGAADDDADAS
jgi:uncharacterized protein YdeI (BOF family)